MGFLGNSQLKQFSCGDAIPGSSGMLALAFGPASGALSGDILGFRLKFYLLHCFLVFFFNVL